MKMPNTFELSIQNINKYTMVFVLKGFAPCFYYISQLLVLEGTARKKKMLQMIIDLDK
jgi:hypothetical protein